MDKSQLKQIIGQAPDIVTILALFLLFCSATPYFKSNMLTDTLSNFTFQYAVLALLLMVVALLTQMTSALSPLVIAFVLCVIQLAPFMAYTMPEAAMGRPVKILQANVLKTSTDISQLKNLIDKENPDVIILAETTAVHDPLFNDLKRSYPYQLIAYRAADSSFGMALLSRLPAEDQEEMFFESKEVPALRMTLRVDQTRINVLSLHPMNPLKDLSARNREFEKLGDIYSENRPANLIIAGDMNATPYSSVFKQSMKDAGVVSARKGHGIVGTYPSWLPTSLLRLPIDQVMVSKSMTVLSFRAGSHIGSDHLPTITEVAVRK